MAIETVPLNPFVGAAVRGVRLSAPLRAETWSSIHAALLAHGVVLFRDQNLTKAGHVAFSRRFGNLERYLMGVNTDPDHPEIFVIGNVHEAGGAVPYLGTVNRAWHSDSAFLAEPSTASLLYCRIAPRRGGDTLFASTRTAFDTLPAALEARIDGRLARYSYVSVHQHFLDTEMPDAEPLTAEERDRHPDVWHPLVRQHPETGATSLFITEDTACEISGLDDAERTELVRALCGHITRDGAVYRHHWRPGDLIIWDNRCTMHAATGFDTDTEQRLMHRTTIVGARPIAAH